MTENSNTQVPAVAITDGKVTTTSLNVAEVFGKQHAHVIRDIERMKSNCPESYHESIFGLTFCEVPGPNGATRKSPMYLLTRDGLTLLVMGYTGKKAMEFKIAYIEAFNKMEEQLKAQAPAGAIAPHPSKGELPAKLTEEAESRPSLREVMRELERASGLHMTTCHRQLKAALGLKSVANLTPEQEAAAIEWARGRIAGLERKPQAPDVITADLCKRIEESLAGKPLDGRIAIRQRVLATLEGTASAPALPAPPAAPALTPDMVIQASNLFPVEDKRRKCTEWSVAETLKKALVLLDNAFQHSSFIDKEGQCPIKDFRKSLLIACRRNIDAAGALARALIAAEESPNLAP